VRWADYEGSGEIWSWKGGLDAQLTDELRLRGTYSRDTRAGNMADRFDRTGGAANATDKKVPGAGEPPIPTPAAYGFTIVRGGNPNIKPETGDTFTVGAVYRPDWFAGFSVSVDWLKVDLKDAIELLTPQNIIDLCYVQGDQDQCARITRAVDTGTGFDTITFINQQVQNIGKATYEGLDFELAYGRGITLFGGGERLSARLFGTYLMESSTTNYAGVKTDNTGSVASQHFKKRINLNLGYLRGPFSWNINGRYDSGGINSIFNNVETNGVVANWNVTDNATGASVYWDTRLAYRFTAGGVETEIFGNIQNVFDRDPPLISTLEGVGQTLGGYDLLGRRYAVGINLRF